MKKDAALLSVSPYPCAASQRALDVEPQGGATDASCRPDGTGLGPVGKEPGTKPGGVERALASHAWAAYLQDGAAEGDGEELLDVRRQGRPARHHKAQPPAEARLDGRKHDAVQPGRQLHRSFHKAQRQAAGLNQTTGSDSPAKCSMLRCLSLTHCPSFAITSVVMKTAEHKEA